MEQQLEHTDITSEKTQKNSISEGQEITSNYIYIKKKEGKKNQRTTPKNKDIAQSTSSSIENQKPKEKKKIRTPYKENQGNIGTLAGSFVKASNSPFSGSYYENKNMESPIQNSEIQNSPSTQTLETPKRKNETPKQKNHFDNYNEHDNRQNNSYNHSPFKTQEKRFSNQKIQKKWKNN